MFLCRFGFNTLEVLCGGVRFVFSFESVTYIVFQMDFIGVTLIIF